MAWFLGYHYNLIQISPLNFQVTFNEQYIVERTQWIVFGFLLKFLSQEVCFPLISSKLKVVRFEVVLFAVRSPVYQEKLIINYFEEKKNNHHTRGPSSP